MHATLKTLLAARSVGNVGRSLICFPSPLVFPRWLLLAARGATRVRHTQTHTHGRTTGGGQCETVIKEPVHTCASSCDSCCWLNVGGSATASANGGGERGGPMQILDRALSCTRRITCRPSFSH